MTLERNLTLRDDLAITPAELIENASTQAKLLMSIVEQTNCYQTISGKKYLQVEAWETIGAFNRIHAVTRRTNPIIRDGEIIGYQADVELLKDGLIVGGASMPCFFTENACKGKEGDAKHKASMSASQTFATSKAYRMNYSYVAILAGYQPTPAEEMTGEAVDDRLANSEHWCEEHKTKFFKRGKMKNYAHQLPGGKWCNEDTAQAPTSTLHSASSSGIAVESSEIIPESKETSQKQDDDLGIDMDWVKETMKQTKFPLPTLLSWLKSKANYTGLDVTGGVEDIIGRMTKAQKEFLSKYLQERVELALPETSLAST